MKHLWCLPALFLAGCANLPQAERVSEFGKATTAATAFAKDSIAANKTIALRFNDERLAATYIIGRSCAPEGDPDYKPDCRGSSFDLTGAPQNILPSDLTGARVRALTALGEYGDALAKAADPAQIDKLETAAAKLGDAAASLTAAFPPVAPVASPAIKLVFRGFGFFLGSTYAAEVNAVVIESDQHVKEVTRMLKSDFSQLSKLLAAQAKTYEGARKANLAAVRYKESDKLRLYAEFKAARQDTAAVILLSQAASKFSSIFQEIADTHEALAKGDPDAERTLRRLLVLMNDATELVKVIQAERKS